MADAKSTTKSVATAAAEVPAANEALTTTTSNKALALQAPSYIAQGREGLEDMSREDVLIPRLVLAQPLHPQVTEGDPNFIEGLRPGMFFNSITREVYGKEVTVQILKKDALRAMEFFPQDDGGGVKDPNVPLTDPRLKWGEDGEKPVATLFRDYYARLLPSEEMIALSFKSSGIKAAKTLNGLIVLRNRPIFAGRYKITSAMELKPKPHWIFKVENDGWVTEEQAQTGRMMWEAVKDLAPNAIDREVGNVEDFEFGANREPGSDDEDPRSPGRTDM